MLHYHCVSIDVANACLCANCGLQFFKCTLFLSKPSNMASSVVKSENMASHKGSSAVSRDKMESLDEGRSVVKREKMESLHEGRSVVKRQNIGASSSWENDKEAEDGGRAR